jgi:hypothetical protein
MKGVTKTVNLCELKRGEIRGGTKNSQFGRKKRAMLFLQSPLTAFASCRFQWIPVDSTGISHIPVESGIRWNFVVRLDKIKIQWILDSTGIHSIVYRHAKRRELLGLGSGYTY